MASPDGGYVTCSKNGQPIHQCRPRGRPEGENTVNRFLKTAAAMAALLAAGAAAPAPGGEEKLARNLAALLIAGRSVVAANQPLINDANKGDKGFTAAVFGAAVAAEFKAKAGIDLAALDRSKADDKRLLALFDAQKEIVTEAQPMINAPGMAFKGFTPAVFGLGASQKFTAATGVYLKQTSEKYRNPLNQPDAFEKKVLAKFTASDWEKGKGFAEAGDLKGKKAVRYMQPLYIGKACLTCHGDPKGELDIAGRAKEGYHEGELRGAVSVAVPVGL